VAIFSCNTSFPFVSFTSFILIFYGLTVLFIDSLFYNIFANGYASLSYNSFNLSYNLVFNSSALLFPLSLFLLSYSFLFPLLLLLYGRYLVLFHSSLTIFSLGSIVNYPMHTTFSSTPSSFTLPWYYYYRYAIGLLLHSITIPFLARDYQHHYSYHLFSSFHRHSNLVSYLNLLSLSYFNYVISITESCRLFASMGSYSLSFIYSFIPLSIIFFFFI
jgi:hypothetical protein